VEAVSFRKAAYISVAVDNDKWMPIAYCVSSHILSAGKTAVAVGLWGPFHDTKLVSHTAFVQSLACVRSLYQRHSCQGKDCQPGTARIQIWTLARSHQLLCRVICPKKRSTQIAGQEQAMGVQMSFNRCNPFLTGVRISMSVALTTSELQRQLVFALIVIVLVLKHKPML
jgi:hypothetical protein